jgi:predicted permease
VEKPSERPDSNFRIAGPGYFETMGIARIAGRSFDSNDTADKPLVAVVNRSFAKRFFPEGHVLGRRVSFDRNAGAANADWFTVVGVVGDVRGNALDSEAGEEIYVCSTQVPYPKASLVVRTHGRPGAMAGAVRSAVLAVDADLPIFNVRPVSAVVGGSVGSIRFSTVLLGLFAAVALLLASIGVYGMLSFSVGQRAREVGIRLALGANRIQVADLVVRRGMGPVVAGIALGSIGALGLAGFLSSRVFGASAMDAWTFAGVGATLLFAALLASIVPTVRMTRIDSATVLREE